MINIIILLKRLWRYILGHMLYKKEKMSMGMPQIPEGTNRPTLDQTIVDLLESIALEEMAMAHIMNAEGEKMQEVVKQFGSSDICHHQVQSSCKDTQAMMNNLIMKEWLLFNRMNSIIKISDDNERQKRNGCECGCCNLD